MKLWSELEAELERREAVGLRRQLRLVPQGCLDIASNDYLGLANHPVLKEAEPYYKEGGKEGVLISHGFTGSTQSMRPLADAMAEAGFTVCLPRLKGHGTHYEDMERTSRHDWIGSVEEGYSWLSERCDTIYMAGLSMGGTLTLYMAERHPDIKAIALINAAIDMPALWPHR